MLTDISVDLSPLEGAYLRDLLAQPQALTDTVAGLRALAPLSVHTLAGRRIVLTGLGSSFHGLHPLQLRLVRAGHTALMVETEQLVQAQSALLDERTLLIAVSQSGQGAVIGRLLDLLGTRKPQPFVIGVTGRADSPLALYADTVVPLKAGAEFPASGKTYLTTLIALEWLGGALCGDDAGGVFREIDQAALAVRDYLSNWHTRVARHAGKFSGCRHLFLLGRGRHRGVDPQGIHRVSG